MCNGGGDNMAMKRWDRMKFDFASHNIINLNCAGNYWWIKNACTAEQLRHVSQLRATELYVVETGIGFEIRPWF